MTSTLNSKAKFGCGLPWNWVTIDTIVCPLVHINNKHGMILDIELSLEVPNSFSYWACSGMLRLTEFVFSLNDELHTEVLTDLDK